MAAAICCYSLLFADIFCYVLLVGAICCYLQPFATICCYLLVFGPKVVPKWYQHGPKIDPISTPNHPWGSQGPPNPILNFRVKFGVHVGTQKGPQNRQKTTKKRARKRSRFQCRFVTHLITKSVGNSSRNRPKIAPGMTNEPKKRYCQTCNPSHTKTRFWGCWETSESTTNRYKSPPEPNARKYRIVARFFSFFGQLWTPK